MKTPKNYDAGSVASHDLFAVDGKIDLCLRMMVYAAFDDKHGDLTPSEVKQNLSAFFPPETLRAAEKLSREGWLPPRVDLTFYSANASVMARQK